MLPWGCVMGEPALSLDALVARVVSEAVREASARAVAEATTAAVYYDQDTAPVARSRYLRAARANAFPNSRVGNRVLAKRADVDAWIASKARSARPKPTTQGDDLDALLDANGFRPAR